MSLSPSNEDYLEKIIMLESENGTVRVSDISRSMGVSKPSVNHAINVLKDNKLINHESYGKIELTEKGRKLGERIYYIHRALKDFITRVLNVDENKAEADACKIEHHISDNTLTRLVDFMEFLGDFTKDNPDWLEAFKKYLKKKGLDSRF